MRQIRHAVALVAILGHAQLAAQEGPRTSQTTVVPEYARFEIVQSPILARLTIRLDRHTGQTWQLVEKAENDFAWQPMTRIAAPNDTQVSGKVNYQIFLSGIRAGITVLINNNTGASWFVAEDQKLGNNFWNPMN